MKNNVRLLYAFSFFDPFMMVIPLLVPYLATKGISMRQFMELQAVFAFVIVLAEMPTGLLSDLWGRKKTLILGSLLKAVSFTLLPFWDSYEGLLFYHITMGLALSLISGTDIAFLYDSHLALSGGSAQGASVIGKAKLAEKTGAAVSALLGGAVAALSYAHLLWGNALFSWIPLLLALRLTEPQAGTPPLLKPSAGLKEALSGVLLKDATTRLVFLNLIAWGLAGLVMAWTNQKYWHEAHVPLAYFGALWAGYNLLMGACAGGAARLQGKFGRGPALAAVGAIPVVAFFGMAYFVGWIGLLFGALIQASRGLGEVLLLQALNDKTASTFRATVISMANLGIRGAFCLLGPLVGYGIDRWGLAAVLPALGLLFTSAFIGLLLPLIRRQP